MKIIKIIIIAGFAIFTVSCSNNRESKSKTSVSDKKTENKNADTLVGKVEIPANKTAEKKIDKLPQSNKEDGKVSGSVIFSNSYCGGAYPPKEIRDEYEKTHPFPNSTFFLEGKSLIKYKFTTDNQGFFSLQIPEGVYDLHMTTSFSKTAGSNFNASCEVWLEKSFGEVEIKSSKTTGYVLHYYFGCNPCEPPRP